MLLAGAQSYGQTNLVALTCNETLTLSGSPYTVNNSITVQSGCSLTINAGVEIKMAENAHLIVKGKVDFLGTASQHIKIHALDSIWGNIFLDSTVSQKSTFKYVEIENARHSVDIHQEPGAIYGYYSALEVQNCYFRNNLRCVSNYKCPKFVIKDCTLDSTNDGEKLHGQYCDGAVIDNCILYSTHGDNDAIDFDASHNITISNNYIYASGDDGIDIGQCDSIGCDTVTIVGNFIINCFNKGISNGEYCLHENINHNVIVGCQLGIGVKSGAHVIADHNTLYHNQVGVYSYEHTNQIWGPGNLVVTNCIIAASDTTWEVDPTAFLSISYSLSDSSLLAGTGNIMGDPKFFAPLSTFFPDCCGMGDYHLNYASAAIDKGDPAFAFDPDGSRSDIGRFYLGQNTSGIEAVQNSDYELIYPNPNKGKFTLRLKPDNKIDRLVVLNILGKIIQQNEFSGSKTEYQIDLSSQSAGVYYLQLYTGNNMFTQKEIIY